MKLTEDQLADAAVCYATTPIGLVDLAAQYGVSTMGLRRMLIAAGVRMRPRGSHAHARPNERATLDTWRCIICHQGRAGGVTPHHATPRTDGTPSYRSYCTPCHNAYQRERYHRNKGRQGVTR